MSDQTYHGTFGQGLRGLGAVRAEASSGLSYAAPAPAAPMASASGGGDRMGSGSHDRNPLDLNPGGTFTEFEKRLPEAAAARYVELAERKADAEALYRAPTRESNELIKVIDEDERRIAELTDGRHFKPQPEDSPNVVQARAVLASHKAKLRRLNERQEVHARHRSAIAGVIDRIDQYLSAGAAPRLQPVTAPKIGKSDTLEAVSARIVELRQQLEEVHAAPWPAADAKARAAREIAALAAQGRIDVTSSVLHRSQLAWPVRQRDIVLSGFGRTDARGMPDMFDETRMTYPVALFAWLHQDEIVAKVHAEIDAVSDEAKALSAEERGGRVARITASILAEQRVLAEIIWRDGAHDRWPDDVDPRAALGVDGPAPRHD